MTNIVSALTARTQLGQILKRATNNNERFVVDRRGQPSVVIMSVKDYVDVIAPPPAVVEGYPNCLEATGHSQAEHPSN
jgi:prevent-host-death family protein